MITCRNCGWPIIFTNGRWEHVETCSDHCYAPGGGKEYDEAVATPEDPADEARVRAPERASEGVEGVEGTTSEVERVDAASEVERATSEGVEGVDTSTTSDN